MKIANTLYMTSDRLSSNKSILYHFNILDESSENNLDLSEYPC